ncbi:MAG: NAD(P)H-binding protein [Saprospiraceae bacterium]|nr:NAD(P)H-binding protein [Saprospiraceae bacterium]
MKELVTQGHRVSALIRTSSLSDPGKINTLKAQGVTLVEGDIEDQKSLARACQGQDVVVCGCISGDIG